MSDPHARALAALDCLNATDLDAVAFSAWQEVRVAILEAQAQHDALLKEVLALRQTCLGLVTAAAVGGREAYWSLADSQEIPDETSPSDLLGLLGLLPDVSLALGPGSAE